MKAPPMPDKKNYTAREIIEDTVTDVPKPTRLGKMAYGKISRKLKIPKPQKRNIEKENAAIIKQLELLKEKIDWGTWENKTKSKNVFSQSAKDITENAITYLCNYLGINTGYDARWINDLIDVGWNAGRKANLTHDKRLRAGQLMHYCIKNAMSKLQAYHLADKIYRIGKTEAKVTYRHFEKTIKENYFPYIATKEYIPIYIMLDLIKYGRVEGFRLSPRLLRKSEEKFENMMQDAADLLKNEIKFAQKNKLEKLGVEINPIITEFLNKKYKEPEGLILEIQENDRAKWQFTLFVRQFLSDIALYKSIA